jgi:hypothetical protein
MNGFGHQWLYSPESQNELPAAEPGNTRDPRLLKFQGLLLSRYTAFTCTHGKQRSTRKYPPALGIAPVITGTMPDSFPGGHPGEDNGSGDLENGIEHGDGFRRGTAAFSPETPGPHFPITRMELT